jgi:hypothetical protein
MMGVAKEFDQNPSPVKRAKLLARVERALKPKHEGVHERLQSYYLFGSRVRARAGFLSFLSFTPTRAHPLGVDERREGVLVTLHMINVDRRGGGHMLMPVVAYLPHHALGRMHERGMDLSIEAATCIAYTGILGSILGPFDTHRDADLTLTIGEVVLTGVMRAQGDGSAKHFWDVRTALPADAPGCGERRERGLITHEVIRKWLRDDYSSTRELAAEIPYRSTDGDHVSRMLVARAGQGERPQ